MSSLSYRTMTCTWHIFRKQLGDINRDGLWSDLKSDQQRRMYVDQLQIPFWSDLSVSDRGLNAKSWFWVKSSAEVNKMILLKDRSHLFSWSLSSLKKGLWCCDGWNFGSAENEIWQELKPPLMCVWVCERCIEPGPSQLGDTSGLGSLTSAGHHHVNSALFFPAAWRRCVHCCH